jgi:hypothetical protein
MCREAIMLCLSLVSVAWTDAYDEQRPTQSAFSTLGIAAYEAGYPAAALSWLNAAVYDSRIAEGVSSPDPWATLYLARMHYLGEATPADPSLACALFETAVRDQQGSAADPNTRAKFLRIIGADPCVAVGGSSAPEVRALMSECFLPGVSPSRFNLPTGSLVIDRMGAHIRSGDHLEESHLPGFDGCNVVALPPFFLAEIPGNDSYPARYFAYMFGWQSNREQNQIVRRLRWYLYEVGTFGIRLSTDETISEQLGVPFPGLEPLPDALSTAVFRRQRNGDLTWTLPAWDRQGTVTK